MKKLLFVAQAVAGLAVAGLSGQASAALFNLTTSSSYTNGTDAGGNYKIFSAADGTQVRVTAWTMTTSGAIVRSTLGVFDQGLGVTAPDTGLLTGIGDNGGSGNLHTVDNKGSTDFLVFQFSTDVTANSVKLSPFAIVQSSSKWSTTYSSVTDATVKFGDTASAWNSYINFAAAGVLASSFTDTQQLYSSTGGAVTQTLTDPTPGAGSLLFISASLANIDGKYDGFKVSNLTVTPAAVPEPASWAMMISGFGLVGGTLRRRQQAPSLATA